jgi:hypothetical protein
MKSQWLFVVTVCFIFVAASQGQSGPDRPPGVDEASWVPISDTAGIVVTAGTVVPMLRLFRDGEVQSVPQRLRQGTGILMVKIGGAWTRIDLELPPPRLQPLL